MISGQVKEDRRGCFDSLVGEGTEVDNEQKWSRTEGTEIIGDQVSKSKNVCRSKQSAAETRLAGRWLCGINWWDERWVDGGMLFTVGAGEIGQTEKRGLSSACGWFLTAHLHSTRYFGTLQLVRCPSGGARPPNFPSKITCKVKIVQTTRRVVTRADDQIGVASGYYSRRHFGVLSKDLGVIGS